MTSENECRKVFAYQKDIRLHRLGICGVLHKIRNSQAQKFLLQGSHRR